MSPRAQSPAWRRAAGGKAPWRWDRPAALRRHRNCDRHRKNGFRAAEPDGPAGTRSLRPRDRRPSASNRFRSRADVPPLREEPRCRRSGYRVLRSRRSRRRNRSNRNRPRPPAQQVNGINGKNASWMLCFLGVFLESKAPKKSSYRLAFRARLYELNRMRYEMEIRIRLPTPHRGGKPPIRGE